MSCEFCRKADFGNFKAMADKYSAAIFLAGGSNRYPKNEQFNFCPMCGEPLTEPVPLTVKQLRERHGKPIWIYDIESPERSSWRICYWDRGKYLVLAAISQTGYLLDEYGEMWLAYDREIKEVHP